MIICICLNPHYCFVLFMITFFSLSLLFYYNISITCIDRSLHNITTHQKQQQRRVGAINIYWLCIIRFVPYLLFCLLYYMIIFPILFFISNYYWLIRFIHIIFNNNTRRHNQQNQSAGMIDMIFVLRCISFFFLSIYLTANILFRYFNTVFCFDFTNINYYLYFLGEFFKY